MNRKLSRRFFSYQLNKDTLFMKFQNIHSLIYQKGRSNLPKTTGWTEIALLLTCNAHIVVPSLQESWSKCCHVSWSRYFLWTFWAQNQGCPLHQDTLIPGRCFIRQSVVSRKVIVAKHWKDRDIRKSLMSHISGQRYVVQHGFGTFTTWPHFMARKISCLDESGNDNLINLIYK